MLMIIMHQAQCRGNENDDRPELGELKRSTTANAEDMREIRCVKCGLSIFFNDRVQHTKECTGGNMNKKQPFQGTEEEREN